MGELSILLGNENSDLYKTENENIIRRLHYCYSKNPEQKIILGNKSLTYKNFIKKINNFASFLQNVKQFDQENPVVLALNGNMYRYVALYGVLASGGYYLPVEPEKNNINRIIDIINNSGCDIAFVTEEISKLVKEAISDEIILFCINNIDLNEINDNYIIDNMKRDSPAYVIYTSGSTGHPKGVIVPHKAVINMILSLRKKLKLVRDDLGISFTSFSFDSCGCDIYTFILNNIPIVTIDNRNQYVQNLEKLNDVCMENEVTVLFLPTVLAEKFVGIKNKFLKVLYFGGEKFCKNIETTYRLCNSYGLTETGILNTFYEMNGYEREIPLGNPIDNTEIVIINNEGEIVDLEVEGEIVVLGESLAIGYKDDPSKTKDKFVDIENMRYKRGYKTGDIGYISRDLNLYYRGRSDKQVKISGYRIELGEIKFKCQQIFGVDISIPMVINDDGSSILVNFYITNNNLGAKKISVELQKLLPFYMMPMYNIKIKKIPYTINGKIDYSFLEKEYQNLRNSLIRDNIDIMSDSLVEGVFDFISNILKVNRTDISIKSNFFELGGDSLKALRLKLNIKDFLGIDIELADIYDDFTIYRIVKLIRGE